MAGIVSYGAYIPPTRLVLAALGGRPAQEGGPEKAVAWNDEDAVTMGVSAAVNCLRGFDRSGVDAVFFASTTYPFGEKQGAALLARALDLPRAVRSADFAGSLRAGTGALRAASDAVAAGSARRVLVVASDCRTGAPGSGLEANLGDAAVAFLVGAEDVIATLDAAFAVAEELVDVWRSAGDRFVHTWEDRFVVQEGYTPAITEAVSGLLEATGTQPGDFARAILYAPDRRSHGGAVRALRLEKDRVQDPLFGRLGNTGCSFALVQLAHALEDSARENACWWQPPATGQRRWPSASPNTWTSSRPGEGSRGIWVAGAVSLRTRPTARPATSTPPSTRLPRTRGCRPPSTSGSGDEDVSFAAQKCNACGAVQFPHQRVCESCFAKDDFARLRLSDKTGRVLTYTFDYFFPTPDPPVVVTICEIEGARVHLQMVNLRPEDVKLDMPVEFEFRRIHQSGGRPNYYWKAAPVPEVD